MNQNRVDTGVAQQHFQPVLGGRIFLEDRLDLLTDGLKHTRSLSVVALVGMPIPGNAREMTLL
jgi:hypothetical protein